MRQLFIVMLCALFCTASSYATTYPAASCSEANVASAISTAQAAGSGNTVTIPSCPSGVVWTTPLSITLTGSLNIIGASSVATTNSDGNPATFNDTTVLIDDVNHTSTDYMISINTGATTNVFRWSGITIAANGSSTTSNNGVWTIGGASQSVRIDHSHWLNNQQLEVNYSGQIYGVFDHNLWTMADLGARTTAAGWSSGTPNQGDGNGDGSWADVATPGASNMMYFENNTFTNTSTGTATPANDCISGGRWVMRFNTFNNGAALQTHPTGHDQGNDRGCRYMEIYKNHFVDGLDGLSNPEYNAMFWSAGTGMIWGNTIDQYRYGVTWHNMRENSNTYQQRAQPSGWGYSGSAQTGSTSTWDQNTIPTTGYLALDQPGAGQSDLLAGDFPNKCDETLGCTTYAGQWPNQVKAPIYEWMDLWTGTVGYPGSFSNIVDPGITQNQDFYLWCNPSAPSGACTFNGSVGVGSGTLAARTTSCTKGVGYWATDQGSWNSSGSGGQGVLYTCTATNTWSSSPTYTPAAYPHPLVSGVTLIGTTTSLSAASTSLSAGASDLLTGTVASSAATGTVTFYDGGSVLGAVALSSGTATFNVVDITAGTHSYTATYGGDSTYSSSTSSAVSVTATSISVPTGLVSRGIAYQ